VRKEKSMRIEKSIITIAVALALMGCYGATYQVSERRYPPTAVGSVQVLYQEPTRPYEVLAFVNHRDTVTYRSRLKSTHYASKLPTWAPTPWSSHRHKGSCSVPVRESMLLERQSGGRDDWMVKMNQAQALVKARLRPERLLFAIGSWFCPRH
jgi:hypothetical protein